MKNTYKHLLQYYIDNEYDVKENDRYNYIDAIKNDVRNEHLLLEISDALNDEIMLKDFSTSLIKDMFIYYTKHCN